MSLEEGIEVAYFRWLADTAIEETSLPYEPVEDYCGIRRCHICRRRTPDVIEQWNAAKRRAFESGRWTPDDEFWNILGV